MRVMIAQTAPNLGALDGNIEHALRLLHTAHDRQVDLVVFPELSLTGQHVGQVHHELAMLPDDDRLQRIVAATGDGPAACVGFVEGDRRSNLFNASAFCAQGRLQDAAVLRGVLQPRRHELPLLKEPRLGLVAAESNRLVDEVGGE